MEVCVCGGGGSTCSMWVYCIAEYSLHSYLAT